MVWEPFYNREYSVTDFNDINRAYSLIRKVSSFLSFFYHKVAAKYPKLPEPFYYDLVDITRQEYQNLFAETLRLFGTHIRDCMPFTDEYTFMKDADVYDSIIKLVTCQDEQGQKRPCTIEEIQKECTALPNCAAFNSNGYLKSFIRKGEKTGKNCEFH